MLSWVTFSAVILLQEGKPLPGPTSRLLSNILKWIVQGDTSADKAKDWEVMPGQRPVGRGNHRELLHHMAHSLRFHGNGVSFQVISGQASYLCPYLAWFRVLSGGASEKAMASNSSILAWKIPWAEEPGSCSPWGREESDTTERLHFHFSLSCIGEGNGNPLQCSCLENPRDRGALWAAVYGVAQSQTRLKQLSSSSSWWCIHYQPR